MPEPDLQGFIEWAKAAGNPDSEWTLRHPEAADLVSRIRKPRVPEEKRESKKKGQVSITVPKAEGEDGEKTLREDFAYQRAEVLLDGSDRYDVNTPIFYIICEFTEKYRQLKDERDLLARQLGPAIVRELGL